MAAKKGKSLEQVAKAKAGAARSASAGKPKVAVVKDGAREAFNALSALLKRHVPPLQVLQQRPASYTVHSRVNGPDGKPYWFGGAALRKGVASYYLFPVFVEPGLLKGVSPSLKKIMEGKSTFNLTRVDPTLLHELEDLTARSVARWKKGGVV